MLAATVSSLLLAALAIATSLVTGGCESHSGPECRAGQYCACGMGPDCFLQCNADACNLECSQTQHSCGTICGNRCTTVCHDTGECSAYCGEACSLECHSVNSCAADCGAGCSYSCHDAQTCAVRVGPNSVVSCDHLTSCSVECVGACDVTCTNMPVIEECSVTCAPGHPRTDDGNGRVHCG